MSDWKPKRRDRIRKFFSQGRLEQPDEKNAGLHGSPCIGESSTHTPTAVPSATSMASPDKMTTPPTTTPTTPTQHLMKPMGPWQKPEPGSAIKDATLKSNPSQPGPISATGAVDTAHTHEECKEKPISTTIPSLWGRALSSDGLSPQERKTLADTSLGVSS